MTLGQLPVHFARAETAQTLEGVELGAGELFDALAAALSFPDYFGRNWDAVADCLSDLDGSTTLLVGDARSRWSENPDQMRMLVDVWLDAAAEREAGELQLVLVW